MKVEIWSDVVCPWCYIGKRRIEAALEQFQQRDEIEVTYRAFELDPDAEPDPGMALEARLSMKYGVPIEKARAMNARVTAVAAEDGLEYRLDRARPGNTFDAHRLIHLAQAEGLQGEMKERLMAAYFVEGRPIGNRDILLELAAEVGLDPRRAWAVLNGDEFAADVRADEKEAAQLGISGVPYFVIDRRYGVSGAQPAQLLVRALDHAWAEAQAAV